MLGSEEQASAYNVARKDKHAEIQKTRIRDLHRSGSSLPNAPTAVDEAKREAPLRAAMPATAHLNNALR